MKKVLILVFFINVPVLLFSLTFEQQKQIEYQNGLNRNIQIVNNYQKYNFDEINIQNTTIIDYNNKVFGDSTPYDAISISKDKLLLCYLKYGKEKNERFNYIYYEYNINLNTIVKLFEESDETFFIMVPKEISENSISYIKSFPHGSVKEKVNIDFNIQTQKKIIKKVHVDSSEVMSSQDNLIKRGRIVRGHNNLRVASTFIKEGNVIKPRLTIKDNLNKSDVLEFGVNPVEIIGGNVLFEYVDEKKEKSFCIYRRDKKNRILRMKTKGRKFKIDMPKAIKKRLKMKGDAVYEVPADIENVYSCTNEHVVVSLNMGRGQPVFAVIDPGASFLK